MSPRSERIERGSMNENGNLPVKSHRQRPTTANGERAKALLNRFGIIRFHELLDKL